MALYESVAVAQPLNLRRELAPPFTIPNAALEITPVDCTHVIQVGADARKITIRAHLASALIEQPGADHAEEDTDDQPGPDLRVHAGVSAPHHARSGQDKEDERERREDVLGGHPQLPPPRWMRAQDRRGMHSVPFIDVLPGALPRVPGH